MFTYKEVAPHLYKWARYYHKLCRDFDVNELVNEVWAKGKIHELKNIKFVSARVQYDIIDYMRQKTRSRGMYWKKQHIDVPEFFTNCEVEYEGDEMMSYFGNIPSNHFNSTQEVENKDEIQYRLQFLTDKQRKLIDMYYFEEIGFKEIGERIGVAECTAFKWTHEALKICKDAPIRKILISSQKNKEQKAKDMIRLALEYEI